MSDEPAATPPSEPTESASPIERRDRHGDVIESSAGSGGPSLGQVVVGSFLVLVGVGWLLEAADLADVPWRAVLPAALIVIGAALVVGSRTGRHGGIIALGIVLTVAVAAASAVEVLIDIPISGGVGEETERVVGTIEDEYRHALGSMTVDLRNGTVTGSGQDVEISLAIGELIVIVPPEVDLDIDARVGMGEVVVFGQESAGLGPDLEFTSPGAGDALLRLDLDVAIGRLEVRR
jgi:hypothetical protein